MGIQSNRTIEENIQDKEFIDYLRNETRLNIVEGDNLKSYFHNEKRIKINNKNNETLIDFELNSKYKEVVPVGNDTQIASLNLRDWKNGLLNILDGMKLYNLKEGYK